MQCFIVDWTKNLGQQTRVAVFIDKMATKYTRISLWKWEDSVFENKILVWSYICNNCLWGNNEEETIFAPREGNEVNFYNIFSGHYLVISKIMLHVKWKKFKKPTKKENKKKFLKYSYSNSKVFKNSTKID